MLNTLLRVRAAKILFRKIKARLTGKYPCSYESVHGHDLEVPSIERGSDWATFQCSKCKAKLTYVKWLGAYI